MELRKNYQFSLLYSCNCCPEPRAKPIKIFNSNYRYYLTKKIEHRYYSGFDGTSIKTKLKLRYYCNVCLERDRQKIKSG